MDLNPSMQVHVLQPNVLFMLDIHFTLSKCAVEQTYGQQ